MLDAIGYGMIVAHRMGVCERTRIKKEKAATYFWTEGFDGGLRGGRY